MLLLLNVVCHVRLGRANLISLFCTSCRPKRLPVQNTVQETHFGGHQSLTFILLPQYKQACVSQFFSQVLWKRWCVSVLLPVELFLAPPRFHVVTSTHFTDLFRFSVMVSIYFRLIPLLLFTQGHSRSTRILIIECSVQNYAWDCSSPLFRSQTSNPASVVVSRIQLWRRKRKRCRPAAAGQTLRSCCHHT